MTTQRLERTQWQLYFDRLSRQLDGKHAEIEVAGLRLGDQIEREWSPLIGLAYDPKDDVFEVATDELDHLISRPRDIYVDHTGLVLRSVDVVDAEGNHQIVRLKEPIALPPPS
jgi:hypothetical protein